MAHGKIATMHPPERPGRKTHQVTVATAAEPSGTLAAAKGPATDASASLEERMIIELCLAGQPHLFRRLVERHQRGILALAYRMLGNAAEADEIAQQSFVDAFSALRGFNPEYRFSSWLYRITINNCKDFLKSKKRTEQALGEDVAQGQAAFTARLPDPESALETRQSEAALHRALAALPVKYRSVLVLKDMEDLSYEEIRQILKLPITTLKIRVVRARKRLKELLESEEAVR